MFSIPATLELLKDWHAVGHWQHERLTNRSPLFLNLTNYGQASFRSDFHHQFTDSKGRVTLLYKQKNPKFSDMMFRQVQPPRMVQTIACFNEDLTKVLVKWHNPYTAEKLHVSLFDADPPLTKKEALANFAEFMAKNDVATRQVEWILRQGGKPREPLWVVPVPEQASKKRRLQ